MVYIIDKNRVLRGGRGRFRTIHTPMVQTGETREMQEKRTPAGGL
nr:MAG TPA: hypothetical protein [Caudoviricetes sp.]